MAQNNVVTGIESQDNSQAIADLLNERLDGLEASLKQQLGSQVQQHQQQTTTDNNTPKEYKLVIHGKEFTYPNAEAASKAVEEALVETREMTTMALNEEFQKKTPNTQHPNTPQGPDPKERFVALVSEDPLKGINYALGQLIFGQEVPDAAGVLRGGIQELQRLRQVQAADQFRRTVPGFQGTPEEVRALEQVRQEFNLPADNPKAFELAYNTAVNRGLIAPHNQKTNTQEARVSPYSVSVPPPTTRETTQEMPDWVSRAEKLPTSQLEKFLTEFQQSGQR